MELNKLISELQERNNDTLSYYYDRKPTDAEVKEINQLTTDTAHAVASAVIESVRKHGVLPEMPTPSASELPQKDYYHEITYKQAHDTVRHHTLSYLTTLEQSLQNNK